MKIAAPLGFVCVVAILLVAGFPAAAKEGFTDGSDPKTFLDENFKGKNVGMVIGLVDEHGITVLAAGKLDNGTDNEVNGDTIFEIGSITKTFTVLLLLDMVERGEMKLDDPVARYLPASVRVPFSGGNQITLLNLAAQDSGLPFNADGLSGKRWKARFDAYTVADMYRFLSSYSLTNKPGAAFQYSNIGMSLLGHVLELKAGADFESLVVRRICQPLRLDATSVRVPASQQSRRAVGHDEDGKATDDFHLQVLAPTGALHSSANDLIKYLQATLGLTPTQLSPLMAKMQVVRHRDHPEMGRTAMPWYDHGVYNPPGSDFLGHGGGTAGASGFIGFDTKKRRGVVVLSNQTTIHSSSVGWRILQGATLSGRNAKSLFPVREYVGSGMAYRLNERDQTLRILSVYPDTSAAKAGVEPGWIVQKVNGVPTTGKSLAECIQLGRGDVGTVVRVELLNPEKTRTNTVELVKQKFLVD